jgi:hypothetical protein
MTDANDIDKLASALLSEAQKLNDSSPVVNELLTAAEQRLITANPGIELWLDNMLERTEDAELWGEEDQQGESRQIGKYFLAYQVGFARVADGWGFAARIVEKQSRNQFDSGVFVRPWRRLGADSEASVTGTKVVPLRNAPMGVRIKALGLVPEIFKRLTALVIERNEAIVNATKQYKK